MIYNVTLCRQLIFEDTIEAENEEEAVEIAMERNGYDDLNWRRNCPTQVVCVEPEYDGSETFGTLVSGNEALYDPREWVDDEENMEWALDEHSYSSEIGSVGSGLMFDVFLLFRLKNA